MGALEIPHKTAYPYIERCVFYIEANFEVLMKMFPFQKPTRDIFFIQELYLNLILFSSL